MGWAKGKGLGVREDGVSEAIRLPVKLNSEGIGYKETDNTHELADEYEKVLASLNQKYRSNNSSASSSVCEEEEGSGKESQSSQRPIRVRHRYTKIRTAKDASSYSQEDLNIIFAVKKSDSSLPSSPSTATSSSSEEKITNSNDKSSKNKDKKSIKKRKVDDDDVNRCGDASQSLSPLVRTSTLSNDSHYSRDGKSCDSVVVCIYLRLSGYFELSFPWFNRLKPLCVPHLGILVNLIYVYIPKIRFIYHSFSNFENMKIHTATWF